MTMPISIRATDGGKIKGPSDIPNVAELAIIFTLPNLKTARVQCHGSFTSAPPDFQLAVNALWTAVSTAWTSNLVALLHTATTLSRVELRNMSSHLNPVFIGTGTGVPGTSASPAMPPDACIVLTENIAARGKGLKGRMYMGGFATNADAGAGLISSAAQTALNAYGTALFNALNAQGLKPCVAQPARQQYQGLTGAIHPSRQAGHVDVTSYSVKDLEWDTQRRRGR